MKPGATGQTHERARGWVCAQQVLGAAAGGAEEGFGEGAGGPRRQHHGTEQLRATFMLMLAECDPGFASFSQRCAQGELREGTRRKAAARGHLPRTGGANSWGKAAGDRTSPSVSHEATTKPGRADQTPAGGRLHAESRHLSKKISLSARFGLRAEIAAVLHGCDLSRTKPQELPANCH